MREIGIDVAVDLEGIELGHGRVRIGLDERELCGTAGFGRKFLDQTWRAQGVNVVQRRQRHQQRELPAVIGVRKALLDSGRRRAAADSGGHGQNGQAQREREEG